MEYIHVWVLESVKIVKESGKGLNLLCTFAGVSVPTGMLLWKRYYWNTWIYVDNFFLRILAHNCEGI